MKDFAKKVVAQMRKRGLCGVLSISDAAGERCCVGGMGKNEMLAAHLQTLTKELGEEFEVGGSYLAAAILLQAATLEGKDAREILTQVMKDSEALE